MKRNVSMQLRPFETSLPKFSVFGSTLINLSTNQRQTACSTAINNVVGYGFGLRDDPCPPLCWARMVSRHNIRTHCVLLVCLPRCVGLDSIWCFSAYRFSYSPNSSDFLLSIISFSFTDSDSDTDPCEILHAARQATRSHPVNHLTSNRY